MAVSSVNTRSLAIDPSGVDSLRQLSRKDPHAAAVGVAKQFEALMLQQMLSAMRQASPVQDEHDSGFAMFRSMQDQQFAQITASRGTLGLADTIVRQIEIQQDPSLLRQPIAKKERSSTTVLPTLSSMQAAKPAAISASPAGFLKKLADSAEVAADDLGVDPQLLLAHAALETGWGGKTIKTADGQDSHNLFGIKAGRNWQGKSAEVTTTEYVDGVAQKRVEKFRAYDSYADAFADYAQLIRQRYGAAVASGNDAQGYAEVLQSGGYATDPQYGEKFVKVAQSVADRLAANQSPSRIAG